MVLSREHPRQRPPGGRIRTIKSSNHEVSDSQAEPDTVNSALDVGRNARCSTSLILSSRSCSRPGYARKEKDIMHFELDAKKTLGLRPKPPGLDDLLQQ